MAPCKVDHVDVVAHTRTVGGGVVVAEHADALELAGGNLGHIGKKVVGDALRIFADKAALVGADRIEVP